LRPCSRRGNPIERINQAYERMLKSDVKYRFVIDLATLA
jgi:alcohol dehydrogenase (NADP+)